MNHFWEPSTGEPPIIPSKHVRLSIRTCPELLGSLASSSLAIVGLVRAACLATPGDISILECLIFHSGPFLTLRNHLYITYEYQDSTEQLRHPKHPPPKRQLYDACMERAWVDGPIGGACDRLLLVGLGLGIGDWVRVCSTCCPQRGHDYHHPAAALNKSLTLFSYVAPSFFPWFLWVGERWNRIPIYPWSICDDFFAKNISISWSSLVYKKSLCFTDFDVSISETDLFHSSFTFRAWDIRSNRCTSQWSPSRPSFRRFATRAWYSPARHTPGCRKWLRGRGPTNTSSRSGLVNCPPTIGSHQKCPSQPWGVPKSPFHRDIG